MLWYQQFRSLDTRSKVTVGVMVVVLAVMLFVAVNGLLHGGNALLEVIFLLEWVAILVGIAGLYVYTARQFRLPLPVALQSPEDEPHRNWRVLAMSLIVIVFSVLAMMIQHMVKM
jgi:archaellum biogenesis protein FlaJ (TadC family)